MSRILLNPRVIRFELERKSVLVLQNYKTRTVLASSNWIKHLLTRPKRETERAVGSLKIKQTTSCLSQSQAQQ